MLSYEQPDETLSHYPRPLIILSNHRELEQ